ncbi:MAG: hypothetical protein DHS20C11_26010 [Lysobacteraceae bacterium]|nr:MAG: hypothetical protein DHS20C11_26010 [Xanthomonadaceae bacterium]
MRPTLLLSLLSCSLAAHAETFCVSSATSFANALLAAQSNNSSDDIRLKPGNYAAPSGGFAMNISQSGETRISGGWQDRQIGNLLIPCDSQPHTAWQTTIDGHFDEPGLHINITAASASLQIDRLTFANGIATLYGGGLDVRYTPGNSTSVEIADNVFRNNHAGYGGGLRAEASSYLAVHNNLIALNSCEFHYCGALLTIDDGGTAHVVNNTIVDNTHIFSTGLGGLALVGAGAGWLVNNLAWGSSNVDLVLNDLNTPFLMYHNAFGVLAGTPDAVSSGNLILQDPVFEPGLFNYRISRESPLVDRGVSGLHVPYSDTDLDGLDRLIGPEIDIGAFENDLLISDGFDPNGIF